MLIIMYEWSTDAIMDLQLELMYIEPLGKYCVLPFCCPVQWTTLTE